MTSFPAPQILVPGTRAGASPAPVTTRTGIEAERRETPEERSHRETATLMKLTGAGIVIILALFLGMMFVLGGYGPSNPL